MSVRFNKKSIPGEVYFVTITVRQWQKVFVDEFTCGLVCRWFDYMRIQYGNVIHAYTIMPNHLHLLVRLSLKSPSLSVLVMNGKRFIAKEIVSHLESLNCHDILNIFREKARVINGSSYSAFEDRYDSLLIQSDGFFRQKLKYIHDNPCEEKESLASLPENYKYSSATNYAGFDSFYSNVDVIEL